MINNNYEYDMYKKRFFICSLVCLLPLFMHAQQPRARIDSMQYAIREYRKSVKQDIRDYKDSVRFVRHNLSIAMPSELRIGWGDQMFENLMWREAEYPINLSPSYQSTYSEDFRYTQHWFMEYLYNVDYWYSFGLHIDYSGVIWDEVIRDGEGVELSREIDQQFHNIAILPIVRFSYYHHEYVSLYSALGVGVNVNTGTEIDYKGRVTVVSPAVNVTLLGMCVGRGRCYGALEIGGMFALNSTDEIFMMGSRIFTASVGVRL